jgi:hypothetical protein
MKELEELPLLHHCKTMCLLENLIPEPYCFEFTFKQTYLKETLILLHLTLMFILDNLQGRAGS